MGLVMIRDKEQKRFGLSAMLILLMAIATLLCLVFVLNNNTGSKQAMNQTEYICEQNCIEKVNGLSIPKNPVPRGACYSSEHLNSTELKCCFKSENPLK